MQDKVYKPPVGRSRMPRARRSAYQAIVFDDLR